MTTTDAVRTYRFRLYPTPEQAARLALWLMRCRHLYNDMLSHRVWAWQARRISITYHDQQNALPDIRRAFPEARGVGVDAAGRYTR